MIDRGVELVLVADLDGTLIAPSEAIGPGCRELVAAIRAQNGILVPASARPLDSIAGVFSEIGAVDLVVSSGGGVIGRVAKGQSRAVLHEEVLTLASGAAFIAELHARAQAGEGVLFEFADSSRNFAVSIVGGHLLTADERSTIAGQRPIAPTGEDLGALSNTSRRALGVSFLIGAAASDRDTVLPPGIDDALRDLPDDWRWTTYPESRLRGWRWLEIFPRHAAKGHAAERVLSMLARDDRRPMMIAAGDAADDIPLLSLAVHGWCPSSAADEVKGAADEVLQVAGGDAFASALAQRVRTIDVHRRP